MKFITDATFFQHFEVIFDKSCNKRSRTIDSVSKIDFKLLLFKLKLLNHPIDLNLVQKKPVVSPHREILKTKVTLSSHL